VHMHMYYVCLWIWIYVKWYHYHWQGISIYQILASCREFNHFTSMHFEKKSAGKKINRSLFQTKNNVNINVQRRKSSTLTVSMIEPAFRPISLTSLYLCLFSKAQCPWTGSALICSARRKVWCAADMPEVLLIRDRWIAIPQGYYILELKVTR